LSNIIPEGAKRVRLNVVVRSSVPCNTIVFRKHGQQNPYNVDGITTQQNTTAHFRTNIEVNLDSERIIEYYMSDGNKFDMVLIAVVGWWI